MELPSKKLNQTAFNTKPIIEEHMLVVMDKSAHEEHLSQPLQTNNKQCKMAVTFQIGYNGIFNVTDENIKFYSTKSINDDDFNVITFPNGAFEVGIFNDEIKRIIIKEVFFTEENYPLVIKPSFSNLFSILEIKTNFIGSQTSFILDDTIRIF